MSNQGSLKSDVLHLGILAGLCLLIGVHQIRKPALISPDAVFYIGLAQKLPGDYVGVARTYPAGYPFILWAAHEAATLVAGHDVSTLWLYSAQGVTLLCRMLALIPLYFLGKLLVGAGKGSQTRGIAFGGPSSFWALLILIVLPYPAQYAGDVLREWPYILFLGLGFWLLCWSLRRRQWWVLALVGLDAGLGYTIRPECVQLVLYGFVGLASVCFAARRVRAWTLCGAGLLLVAGFLALAVPNVLATGILMPHQFRPFTMSNAPPVIHAIGPKAACDDPLEFEVAENELLELPIRASDPDGDPVTFSLVGVPVGSRPTYQFWSMVMGGHFWTTLEDEKRRLLSTYCRDVWDYEGIAFYAYAQADARTGLHGVHRFWSPARRRHFYTMDEREKEAILREPSEDPWAYEGVVFYAFAEGDRPGDTVPVYRLSGQENGDSWEVGDGKPRTGTVAWYMHPAGEPPAGAGIEDGVFRWRPKPGQKGDHQINIIVSDGRLESCQLVVIRVTAARSAGAPVLRPRIEVWGDSIADGGFDPRSEGDPVSRAWVPKREISRLRVQASLRFEGGTPSTRETPSIRAASLAAQYAGMEMLPGAVNKVFAGVAEDLMVVFFVPWLLGLSWRLRYQAERTERVLIVAVVIVNVALMLARHVGLGSGDDRRYALGMIALTIFYVPVGIEVLARWLNSIRPLPRPQWMPRSLPGLPWFYLLVAVGLVACLPKLLMASPGNKAGYRTAAEWLQQNTKADDVLAVPDVRISFYAQRQGLFYVQHPNSRRADYVVMIDDGGEGQIPEGWRREYSVTVDRRSKKTLAIYSTARPKR